MDGRVAGLGERVDPMTVRVTIDGLPLPLDPGLATWLVYKPPGVVTTMDDPHGRPTVVDLVPPEPITKPVGRLDLDSEGLLLMTNDGDLAHVVTHPRHGVPKTYQVLVAGPVTPSQIALLLDGIELDDGPARARAARVIDRSRGRSLVELVLTEGRNREIRRMFDALDLPIDRLVRTAIGPIVDRKLAPGAYRALTVEEIRSLHASAHERNDDA